jgi:hypothetical protein
MYTIHKQRSMIGINLHKNLPKKREVAYYVSDGKRWAHFDVHALNGCPDKQKLK